MDRSKEELPLTGAQLSVWLDAQLHPNDTQYSIWDTIEIDGNLDVPLFVEALKHVIATSANFRLKFVGERLSPRQVIRESIAVEIPIFDYTQLPDPMAAANEFMANDHRRAYDLYADVLFRNSIFVISPVRTVWYLNYHHLIIDGFSIGLFVMWLAEAYRGLKAGQRPERIYGSYLNYIQAEADYRQSEQYRSDKAFWANLYENLPSPVTLSVRGGRRDLQREVRVTDGWLPGDLQVAFYALSKELGIGLGQVLIGAIALYIHVVTRARDLPVCMPTHGRERGPTLEMMGMCTNALPLRVQIDPEQTLADHLRQVASHIKAVLEHRRYRYEDICKDLGAGRNEIVPFRLHANILRTVDESTVTEEGGRLITNTAGPVQDLYFMLYENRGNTEAFRLGLMWNASLYEEWEVQHHHRYFKRMLEAIVTSPNTRLRDVELVSAAEKSTIVTEWNATDRNWDAPNRFHALVSRQVAKLRDSVALVSGEVQLTYGELDDQANRIANFLASHGVVRGEVVGICLDRSPSVIVSFLGIMKAGAVYLPLEPDLPEARLTLMVKDAGVKRILTHSDHEMRLPDHLAELLFVDSMSAEIEAHSANDPNVQMDSSDLAYVIYTSGSTGQPKCVQLQHDGLCNLALAQAEQFGVEIGTRVLQFAKLSFDASVSEIAMTLVGGGVLVVADRYSLLPGNLGRTLADSGIQLVTLPPTVLPTLQNDSLPALRTLVVAGETCPTELAEEWSKRCRLINAYGPTETTVCATAGEYAGAGVVSIGRPIANMTAYILDEFLNPVPIGVKGEMFVGGVGVARGYLNREEFTRERFIDDPFSRKKGARLYRTGDLARYLPDGNIEFLGRKDDQIKIRGFRVEVGEIEAALMAHPAVSESVVVVREVAGRKQLFGYVVRREGHEHVTNMEFRSALRARLPDYMVPAAIMPIDALPRTSSGKLDRRALPAIDASIFARPYVEPQGETEIRLTKLWETALELERVSATDNFFDIGGDSLATLNVIVLVWDEFKLELLPQEFYRTENLRGLASTIDQMLLSGTLDALHSQSVALVNH